MSDKKTRGRRSAAGAGRRWSPVAIAVVLVPILVALALWTVTPASDEAATASPPTPTALDAIDLMCPTPIGTDPTLSVARAEASVIEGGEPQAAGEILVGLGEDQEPLDVPVGGVVVAPAPSAADVVSATAGMAPGLAGSLAGDKPRASSACATAAAEQWFTGLGAGPTHSSQLELLNPDEANAVADVTVYSDEGVVDVPALRGLAVPAESSVRLNLAELLPQRGQLGLRVTVSRGRLGVFAVDQDDELGASEASREWVPGQPRPERLGVLPGLPIGRDAEHKLVVTNPGPDEAVVSLKVVTSTSAFTPTGLAELQIPPASVGVFLLTDVLAAPEKSKNADDEADEETPLGLVVESSEPVATSLRSIVAGDLSFSVAASAIDQGRTVMPAVKKKDRAAIVFSHGLAATSATVRFLDEQGRILTEQEVTGPESTATGIEVPSRTASVSVESSGNVSAALIITGPNGNVVLPVRQLVTTLLVPDVAPTIR